MAKKSSSIFFKTKKSIITYDLAPCEITAEDIANESSNLFTYVSITDKGKFKLPNTTLVSKLDIENSEKEFKKAVKAASKNEKITKLFIVEIYKKDGYIENDE